MNVWLLVLGWLGWRLRPDLPRVVSDGHLLTDFVFHGAAEHEMPGLINALGIESPGLTACLAMAIHIEQMLHDDMTGRNNAAR